MTKRKRYRVIDDTTVRASPDPEAPDEWIQYPAGSEVSEVPKHADVEGWVASGHWLPITEPAEPEEGA